VLFVNIALDSASDAYAGLQLYHVMEHYRESLDPCPPRPYHAELCLPIRLADGASISTADENAEVLEADTEVTAASALSASFITSVRETIQVEVDGDSDSLLTVSTKTSSIRSTKARTKDPRVIAAESWLADYRACKPVVRAAPSAIRAYRIWFSSKDLTPEAVAALLRQPPLQTNTVVSYILEAIKLEKFAFDKARLRNEVLGLLPKEILAGRYKTLMKMAEEPEPFVGKST
jgi:exonuclease 3'-5' domain-containing protein 2